MSDAWNAADPYEAYVGRWSRKLAPSFVSWTKMPVGARVVEVGCGTGALSEAALAAGASRHIGVDLSRAYVHEARRRLDGPRAGFLVSSALALPLREGSADAALSGLVLNFVPEPASMLREMRRVLAPGGLAALYVWDYAGKMELTRHFWDAAGELDPQAKALDAATRFPMCAPGPLRALFERAGFERVETGAVDQPTRFRDFDDYWTPFLGAQGPAPGYCASLDPKAREALRENIRARLPIAADGSIDLVARAWAVKGYSPASS